MKDSHRPPQPIDKYQIRAKANRLKIKLSSEPMSVSDSHLNSGISGFETLSPLPLNPTTFLMVSNDNLSSKTNGGGGWPVGVIGCSVVIYSEWLRGSPFNPRLSILRFIIDALKDEGIDNDKMIEMMVSKAQPWV